MSDEELFLIVALLAITLIVLWLIRTRLEGPPDIQTWGRRGCAAGGCILPILLLTGTVLAAHSAADLGGPLFWPILALYGGALGLTVGTICFRIFRGRK